jgi:anti-sigma factor RsiW
VNCNDFAADIDRYLDDALDPDAWRVALSHTSGCPACESLVTKYQQASALLQTAVTDRVAAVDVSGLWAVIDSQVPAVLTPAPDAVVRRPVPRSFLERLRDWVTVLTPVRVGAAMATAAAVALLVASLGEETTTERVARNAGGRAKAKAVRIVTMEVPSGYTVSTWSRPRSRTHMISINPAPAYTLASATR